MGYKDISREDLEKRCSDLKEELSTLKDNLDIYADMGEDGKEISEKYVWEVSLEKAKIFAQNLTEYHKLNVRIMVLAGKLSSLYELGERHFPEFSEGLKEEYDKLIGTIADELIGFASHGANANVTLIENYRRMCDKSLPNR